MRIKRSKLTLSVVIMLAMLVAQSCLEEKEDVKPQPEQLAEPSVLEEIENLGFDAASIEDKGTYYLVEGDIYFAKDKIAKRTLPVRGKVKEKIPSGQRPAMTVGIDPTVAANANWKNGLDHAIATWNSNKDHHFTFKMVERSEEADIFLQDDKGELSDDVEVASEFAAHGRAGSTIRVNLDYAASSADQVKTKVLEGLSHSVGHRHADTKKNDFIKTLASAKTQASNPFDYLYLINGDDLVGVRPSPYDVYVVSTSWAGSTKIASTRGALYIIQFDWLFLAYPDGRIYWLTSGWTGTQCLVSVPYDSYSLYAMQDDWLWGISAVDGGWWWITDNGGTSTPWSGTQAMCADAFGNPNGLRVIDRNNTDCFVSTDPTNPSYPPFGKREVNYPSEKVKEALAPEFASDGSTKDVFYINSRKNYGNYGLDADYTFRNHHPVTSDQVIDYSKTQSFVSDEYYVYLLADGGLYSYGYRKPLWTGYAFKTILPPRYVLPTAIMTNLVPKPSIKIPKLPPGL